MSQKGILIKDESGNVIEKHVIAGDTSNDTMTSYVQKFQSVFPKGTVIVFDDKDPAFSDVRVVDKATIEWNSARSKGQQASIDYLAGKLGLE